MIMACVVLGHSRPKWRGSRRVKSRFTLVGLDIEGPWNVPLLENAAQMSGAALMLANCNDVIDDAGKPNDPHPEIDDLLARFDQVLACEPTHQSRNIYDYAAPRGNVGVIVGNERHGIPDTILKKADTTISIPMLGRGMSSVNVAVAGAVILYGLERDLGRKRFRCSSVTHRDVDVSCRGRLTPANLAPCCEALGPSVGSACFSRIAAVYGSLRIVPRFSPAEPRRGAK